MNTYLQAREAIKVEKIAQEMGTLLEASKLLDRLSSEARLWYESHCKPTVRTPEKQQPRCRGCGKSETDCPASWRKMMQKHHWSRFLIDAGVPDNSNPWLCRECFGNGL